MFRAVRLIAIILLLGLSRSMAATKCANFEVHAIKPEGEDVTGYIEENGKPYKPVVLEYLQSLGGNHKFLSALCRAYSRCYGPAFMATEVQSQCINNGWPYVKDEKNPYDAARWLKYFIDGMPKELNERPNCRSATVKVNDSEEGLLMTASGLTEESYSVKEGHALVLLHWMCRQYARCSRQLKQNVIEGLCFDAGRKRMIMDSDMRGKAVQLETFMNFVVDGTIILGGEQS